MKVRRIFFGLLVLLIAAFYVQKVRAVVIGEPGTGDGIIAVPDDGGVHWWWIDRVGNEIIGAATECLNNNCIPNMAAFHISPNTLVVMRIRMGVVPIDGNGTPIADPPLKTTIHLAAEWEVCNVVLTTGEVNISQKGRIGTQSISWDDRIEPLKPAFLILDVCTRKNPNGRQEYTSPGVYPEMFGANFKIKEETEQLSVDIVGPTIIVP